MDFPLPNLLTAVWIYKVAKMTEYFDRKSDFKNGGKQKTQLLKTQLLLDTAYREHCKSKLQLIN